MILWKSVELMLVLGVSLRSVVSRLCWLILVLSSVRVMTVLYSGALFGLGLRTGRLLVLSSAIDSVFKLPSVCLRCG